MPTLERSRRLIDGVWRWVTADESGGGGSLPSGGSTGEVLTKESNADGDVGWEAGGGSQTVKIVDWEFTQTNGDGTYTATADLPGNSLVIGIGAQTTADWDVDPDGAQMLIGDDDAADTYYDGTALGVTSGFFWTDFPTIASTDDWKFYEDATTITAALTTTGSVGTTGRTRVVILYVTDVPVVAAVKS